MAKPSVDGLEEDFSDSAAFTRVNIKDEGGQKLAARYNIRAVPAFLLIAPDGKVLYKKIGGTPERAEVAAHLAP